MDEDYKPVTGTMCFLRVGGKTLLFFRNRGKGDLHQGYYAPPGGHINSGTKERYAKRGIDCIRREFQEETGLRVLNPRLRAIVTFDNFGRELGGKINPLHWKV